MICPHCGGEIGNGIYCQYCGSQITAEMKKEQDIIKRQGCPKCGSADIRFNRDNQGAVYGKNANKIIHRTVGICSSCGFTWYPNLEEEAVTNNNMIWWILGWIFFFPAPVMVLIWRKKNTWNLKTKIIVTALFWVLFFFFGLAGGIH